MVLTALSNPLQTSSASRGGYCSPKFIYRRNRLTGSTKKLLVLIFLLLGASFFALPAEMLLSIAEEPGEYLAFEFSLAGTLQQQPAMLPGQRPPKTFYDTSRALLDYHYDDFSLFVDFAMIDDEIYDPAEVYLLGRYFFIQDAYVEYTADRFSVKAGRTIQKDVVDTPYSLFVSSEAIPSVQLEASYFGDLVFYTTRWVRLNENSKQTYFGTAETSPYWDYPFDEDSDRYPYQEMYPEGIYWLDRGANFHVYGLNLGEWRFGLQESAVTYNSSFNTEFFVSPMIMYLTQLVIEGGAKPWTEYSNTKHFMGFFVDRIDDESYFASQLLIDDVNGDFIPGIDQDNQNRLAWSVGGYKQYPFGRVGFYHAGATKNTFSPTYASTPDKKLDSYEADQLPMYYSTRPYPYTYYPAVQYQLEDGTPMPIDYTRNYIGYKHGENNISFLLTYDNFIAGGDSSFLQTARKTAFGASLEWVLNGAKSPVNPWHEFDHWKEIPNPTELLDGTVEHILLLSGYLHRPVQLFGQPFSLFADMKAGMAFNAMALEPASPDTHDTEPWIYRPQAGVHEPIFQLTIGLTYQWQLAGGTR
jgi:hypothetical protein